MAYVPWILAAIVVAAQLVGPTGLSEKVINRAVKSTEGKILSFNAHKDTEVS